MSAQGRSWLEEMNSASDDDDKDEDNEIPSFKRMKTSDPVRPINGSHSSPSQSQEKSSEFSCTHVLLTRATATRECYLYNYRFMFG